MNTPTVSQLFHDASDRLRSEFEYIRKTNPHAGTKGEEVEEILKKFFNDHLPKRYHTTSGIIIDNEDNVSKQTDVIIYDALASPVYRASDTLQILPIDTIASVVEVKTCLNKKELEDAYEKIASCKKLKKTNLSSIDLKPTGSDLTTIGTLGVVFGFDSDTTLEALAEGMVELNKKYPSELWPNMVVVLDKGVVDYFVQFPGVNEFPGTVCPPCDGKFRSPPFYIHLAIDADDKFTLNRFFIKLLSHLTFFAHRPSAPPFDAILKGAAKQALTIQGYQYDTNQKLNPAPEANWFQNNPKVKLSLVLQTNDGKQLGVLNFVPWQDGAILRWVGVMPLNLFLLPILGTDVMVVQQPNSNVQLSEVLKFTEENFKRLPEIISQKMKNMVGVLHQADEQKKT